MSERFRLRHGKEASPDEIPLGTVGFDRERRLQVGFKNTDHIGLARHRQRQAATEQKGSLLTLRTMPSQHNGQFLANATGHVESHQIDPLLAHPDTLGLRHPKAFGERHQNGANRKRLPQHLHLIGIEATIGQRHEAHRQIADLGTQALAHILRGQDIDHWALQEPISRATSSGVMRANSSGRSARSST